MTSPTPQDPHLPHEPHHPQAVEQPDGPVMCHHCKKIILPGQTALNAINFIFHKECFKCSECHKVLGGTMFKLMEGKPICNECFEKHVQKKVAGICPVCKLEIRGAFLGAINTKFHPDCFNCSKCNINIAKSSFQVKDNKQYCVNCYSELFAPHCSVCQKPIRPSEPYLQVEKHNIHQGCFICNKCKIPLAGKPFGIKKNLYFCQPHSINS